RGGEGGGAATGRGRGRHRLRRHLCAARGAGGEGRRRRVPARRGGRRRRGRGGRPVMIVLRAQARVNVAAIERNCVRLRSELRDGVALCAVVKADGYGHGAVQSARAALSGGASWLAVAGAREAPELRDAG